SLEEAGTWQRESAEPIEVMQFSGHHFFIFSHVEKIIRLIAEKTIEENYLANKDPKHTQR
ncbi:MAG: hypothetical protein ACKO96_47515, partial [Flammeovirgaceae bacterium]